MAPTETTTALQETIRTAFKTVGDVAVRCAESGEPQQQTILLMSPRPERLYACAAI